MIRFPEDPPIYAIDTCCVMDLNNWHVRRPGVAPPPPKFSAGSAQRIWAGIEKLAQERRLKLIPAVRDELRRLDPEGAQRIGVNAGSRVPALSADLVAVYQHLDRAHPKLVPNDPAKDPADPWLVAYAIVHGWTVVTSEIPAALSRRSASSPKIPDICEAEGAPWISLEDLAVREGWPS